MCFGVWACFWVKCLWILGCALDSGKCLSLRAMVYLIENNSFKDYLGPYKFHLFILFFVVLMIIKSETLYLSFQVGFVAQR